MLRSTLAALLAAMLSVAACAETTQSSTVTAPSEGTAAGPSATADAAPTSPPAPTPSASADSSSDAGASQEPGPGPMGATDSGAPAQFRACTLDSDCVAVDRVGCCRNGWKEAVAASQKDAYAQSFKCPESRPICPMYMVRDKRVAECDNGTQLCTMIAPEDIACGGFIRNQHHCPDGYVCKVSKVPDIPGKCVKP
jgi:hypothetical protein